MLGYIYAVVACYIAVLMEYVLVLRNEQHAAVVVCAFAIINFLVIIGWLFDDRKYLMTFRRHQVVLWGKDFNQVIR